MKCEMCKKNDATIVFTQIVNNEKMVLHLCKECAAKKGLSIEMKSSSHPEVSLMGGFTSTLGSSEKGEKHPPSSGETVPDISCDVCGLSFSTFKSTGLFGCDHCHKAFGGHIKSLLKQIHGTAVHEGKRPKDLSHEVKFRHQLKHLRLELELCVKHEDYERAAELRDRIGELEKKSEPE